MSALPTQDLWGLQSWLQSAIVAPGDQALGSAAAQHLISTSGLPARARLSIYQDSYRLRLLQSFRAVFPGLLHALDEATLDAFVLDFLRQRPPRAHSINRAVEGFADFLRCTRPQSGAHAAPDWIDFIVDLAAVECALLDVADAAGLEHGSERNDADIRRISNADLLGWRPRPASCLRLLSSSFPLHEYLQALRSGDAARMPAPRVSWLALTRVHYRLSMRELAEVQWQLLKRLDGATSLGTAVQSVAVLHLRPLPDADLLRIWMHNFVAQGLVEPIDRFDSIG